MSFKADGSIIMSQFLRSTENQFIIECILANFKEKHTDYFTSYAHTHIHWETVLLQSVQHGVAGLIYRSLADQTEVAVPSTIMERLKCYYYGILILNRTRMDKLRCLLDLIPDIEIMLLKGPAVELLTYPKFAPREYGDIDIFIQPDDWPQVRTVLQQLNYHEVDTNISCLARGTDYRAHIQFSAYSAKKP